MNKKQQILVVCIIGLIFAMIAGFQSGNKDGSSKVNSFEISLKSVKGLQDCLLMAIETDDDKLYVIRCPNSDVSVHWVQGSKNYFTSTADISLTSKIVEKISASSYFGHIL